LTLIGGRTLGRIELDLKDVKRSSRRPVEWYAHLVDSAENMRDVSILLGWPSGTVSGRPLNCV